MTPDEIRDIKPEHTISSSMEVETCRVADAMVIQALLLREIAAQLAELNQHLAALTDPTKGIIANLCATNDDIRVRIVT